MIGLALVWALQAAPSAYSAQCLMEVAGMTGDTFDITDDRMRQAATAKTDALMQSAKRLADGLVELDRAVDAHLREMARREATGELPAGSVEVTRRQQAAERAEMAAVGRSIRFRAPSCDWPAMPESPGP